MKKKNLLNLLICGLLPATVLQAKEKPLNVLFILVDDYGWNDTSCGGSRYYETPNVDRLAKQGMMFTQGYAACQVSSPSRASIMTGKYTPRHGVTTWIGEPSGEDWRKLGRYTKLLPAEYKKSLSQEELTLPEALRAGGYKTFMAGKWHLGGEGSLPENHGFDINIGGCALGSPAGGYFSPYNNPKLKDGPAGENLSMRLADETCHFIEEQIKENPSQPFFAYLSFYAVHGPIQTTQENWRYFRDKADSMGISPEGFKVDRTLPVRQYQDNPVYAGLIKQMDDAVGVVLDKLDKLGLTENTLIIFTGDNGGVSSGDNYSTSCLPLRGGKGRQWEGGLRVPFIIKSPGDKVGGKTCDVPVIGTDFYPTILDFTGLPLHPEQHIDGCSLKPLLQGKTIPARSLYWHYPHYANQGGEPSSVIRDGEWKLIHYYEDGHDELYNLKMDVSESEPLNAQYPDKVDYLHRKLFIWLADVKALFPQADPEYDPKKESECKVRQQTLLLKQLEKERRFQLSESFEPDKDWWGSKIID